MATLNLIWMAVSMVGSVGGVVAALIGLKIKLEISELRTYIEQARREDEQKIRDWVEEHFTRAAK